MAEVLKLSENKSVGPNNPCFIVAEIGQNHQGDLNIAKDLIKIAKECGADCVKFQKTDLQEKFNKAALERPYASENSWGKTYGEHKKYLEFSYAQFKELQNFSEEVGIMFTASAMDLVSLDFLAGINVPFIKIGSGDANNMIIIDAAARKYIPLVVSTGMQNFETVKQIYERISAYHKKFVLLHCVSAYPTPVEEINLKVIELYKKEFNDINIGYSGHELGIDISVAAVAMGAKVIERHFTLNKNQKGSDHKCSLTPEEFKLMVEKIRLIEKAMGNCCKTFQPSETPCYNKLGKTIVLAKTVHSLNKLKLEDLNIKVAEPKGIDGAQINHVIGRTVNKTIQKGESLTEDCLL